MSLIADQKNICRSLENLSEKVKDQQHIYFHMIKGMVELHQKYRIEKQYTISDEIRALLNEIGIVIIQGTSGYKYEDIPKSLKGRQSQDTWKFNND